MPFYSANSPFETTVLPDGSLELSAIAASAYESPTLDVPAKIDGRPLKALGEYLFVGDGKNLTKVRLPDGLERIGDSAFGDCEKICELAVPASVREIGVEAFEGCSSLTQLVIPANVREIGFGAFARCARLAKIDVAPENPRFRSVDGVLFDAETKTLLAFPPGGPERCVVPNGVEQIAYCAFEFSPRLAEIVLPESVRSVGAYAFYECSGLTAIRFPAALCELGYSAFYRCEALRQVEFAPDRTV